MERCGSGGTFRAALAAGLLLLAAAPAAAQFADQPVAELADVGVEERLDARVPADLELRDSDGGAVRFGDLLDGRRPVILTLNYYRCPMLCGLQLNGVVEGLAELDWSIGEQFDVITVSIDPLETPALARDKKQNYLKFYGRPSAGRGWSFLTGREADIRRLADSVGFGFRYDADSGEYAHAAAIMLLTPDGRVARYLYGIEYPPRDLKLALLEASEGTIGSPIDQIIMYCYHYDPSGRRYAPVAMNIMRLGGGATALLLGGSLATVWLRDLRRNRRKEV